MQMILCAFAVGVLAAGPTVVADQAEVMAPVHQFVDSFNKGDGEAAVAACAEETSIIDEFPPHEWHGAGACAQWLTDYNADAKKNGITDGVVVLENPRHIDITADLAYVVVPANYTYKQRGKLVQETASILTLALQKFDVGWRITGWSWAKH